MLRACCFWLCCSKPQDEKLETNESTSNESRRNMSRKHRKEKPGYPLNPVPKSLMKRQPPGSPRSAPPVPQKNPTSGGMRKQGSPYKSVPGSLMDKKTLALRPAMSLQTRSSSVNCRRRHVSSHCKRRHVSTQMRKKKNPIKRRGPGTKRSSQNMLKRSPRARNRHAQKTLGRTREAKKKLKKGPLRRRTHGSTAGKGSRPAISQKSRRRGSSTEHAARGSRPRRERSSRKRSSNDRYNKFSSKGKMSSRGVRKNRRSKLSSTRVSRGEKARSSIISRSRLSSRLADRYKKAKSRISSRGRLSSRHSSHGESTKSRSESRVKRNSGNGRYGHDTSGSVTSVLIKLKRLLKKRSKELSQESQKLKERAQNGLEKQGETGVEDGILNDISRCIQQLHSLKQKRKRELSHEPLSQSQTSSEMKQYIRTTSVKYTFPHIAKKSPTNDWKSKDELLSPASIAEGPSLVEQTYCEYLPHISSPVQVPRKASKTAMVKMVSLESVTPSARRNILRKLSAVENNATQSTLVMVPGENQGGQLQPQIERGLNKSISKTFTRILQESSRSTSSESDSSQTSSQASSEDSSSNKAFSVRVEASQADKGIQYGLHNNCSVLPLPTKQSVEVEAVPDISDDILKSGKREKHPSHRHNHLHHTKASKRGQFTLEGTVNQSELESLFHLIGLTPKKKG